jgi:FlaA1/EpsC-like NDP-sugar epimerase
MTSAISGVNALSTWIEPVAPGLVSAVTGRHQSLLAVDRAAHDAELRSRIARSRVLVVGAAGSIGAAFVKLLVTLAPRGLVLIDLDENGLADLVRDLRSSPWPLPEDFATSAVALGSAGLGRLLAASDPFDVVLNFAALKHVRSERDPYSLMRMIETNVLGLEQLFEQLRPGAELRVFSVSSDKAVSPTNLMGATKRWMERVLQARPPGITCSSARFANVAFSAGSLPHAFLKRLELRQPLAAPSDIRRYFISHTEAAELCLLSAFLGGDGEIFVPRLSAELNAVGMVEVALRVLAARGMVAVPLDSEADAKASPLLRMAHPTGWPCLFVPSDTTGEKELEELHDRSETVDATRYAGLAVVRPSGIDPDVLAAARAKVAKAAAGSVWTKSDLVAAIGTAVPELRHIELGRSLDEKI